MSAGSFSSVTHFRRGRSAATNARSFLAGIDGRSTRARRFRDLMSSFAAGLGGIDALSESELALVRQAASVTMRAEELQSAIARGEAVDPDELIRLSNTSRRLLSGLKRREAPKTKTLSEHLAAKRSAAA